MNLINIAKKTNWGIIKMTKLDKCIKMKALMDGNNAKRSIQDSIWKGI